MWLSAWSEVQMIYVWSTPNHLLLSYNPEEFICLVAVYSVGFSGEASK